MAKSKYETHIQPYLDKVEEWAKQGVDQVTMAKNLHIAPSTFAKYLAMGRDGDERYTEFAERFARACKEPDDKVEAALYKRACGFEYDETTWEEKLTRDGEIVEVKKVVRKTVPPDPTSAMFWLTNRRPLVWQYKRTEKTEDDTGETGVAILPEIGGS